MLISFGKYKKMNFNEKMALAGILLCQQQVCGRRSPGYNHSQMSQQHHGIVKTAGIVLIVYKGVWPEQHRK